MSWLFEGLEHELLALTDPEFIEVWSAMFGGPPAAMIARPDMIAMMREEAAPQPLPALELSQTMPPCDLRPVLELTAAPGHRR